MSSAQQSPDASSDEHDVAWHALDTEEVAARLETGDNGLSDQEVRERIEQYGRNEIEAEQPTSALTIFISQFRSPLIYILVAAAIVTALLGEYIDFGIIAFVLLLNAVIGFTQERQAEKSIQALQKLVSPTARIVRDGQEQDVESAELVPGDIVLFESGTRVPADIRITSATTFAVDESLLTGESTSVEKHPDPIDEDASFADRSNMVFAGSTVASGRGSGYVVATGMNSELGEIVEELREHDSGETPLQARMDRFARIIGLGVLGSIVLAFILGVATGIDATDMFIVGVGLAVAAVPEGLPVVFTITLAIGVHRMAKRNAIIRRLPAVETLGSATVIGSDKTGTLTENQMTVKEIWTPDGWYRIDSNHDDGQASHESTVLSGIDLDEHPALRRVLLAGTLTNEADIESGEDGEDFTLEGDPTEAALLVAASSAGIDPSGLREEQEILGEIPFESDLQYSATARKDGERQILYVKGAPERVLEMCGAMQHGSDTSDLDHDSVSEAAGAMASEGLRVLAMAYRELDDPPDNSDDLPEPNDLILAGLQGMLDPPREGVKEAIAGCQEAGIRVVIITGDHSATASAIGQQLGIAGDDDEILTGSDIQEMSDDDLSQAVERVAVFARVSPEDKLRVVEAIQSHGHIIGVTGDGVNDAPALKTADIGIAMGKSGTDVAREASDMVLTDDNFVSIYGAVEQGRITFSNVRKVTFFLISTGVAAIVTILSTLLLGWPLPFVPAQLLWLNLVTNGLQDVALAFEPGERDLLKKAPRDPDAGIVSRLLWERTAIAGAMMAIGTLVMYWWALEEGLSHPHAQTVALTTMVIFQMFHVFNARSEYRSAFTLNPFSNPYLLAAVAAAFAVHLGALHFGPTQFILRVEPLSLDIWARIFALALSVILVVELHKLVRRDAEHQPATGSQTNAA